MSRIVIDENKCKGCGLCTTVCPFDLIRIADRFNAKGYRPAEYVEHCRSNSGKETVVDLAVSPVSELGGETQPDNNLSPSKQCTGCTNCAAMCPDVAITVYRSRAKPRPQTEPSLSRLADRQTSRATGETYHKGNGREQQPVPQNTQISKSS